MKGLFAFKWYLLYVGKKGIQRNALGRLSSATHL